MLLSTISPTFNQFLKAEKLILSRIQTFYGLEKQNYFAYFGAMSG